MKKNSVWLTAFLVTLVALLIYAATAQRGVSWQDGGEYQYKFLAGAYKWEVGAGIARLHPTYILITRALIACLPWLPVTYVCALSSAVGMALALGILVVLVYELTACKRAGVLAAAVLGGAHMVWWLSTMAEVYTWSLAILLLEVWGLQRALRRRHFGWFALALFFNGLHFGVHNFALLNLPLYAIIFLYFFSRQWWHWLVSLAVWVLGAGPIVVPIWEYWRECRSVALVAQSALFGEVFRDKIFALDVRQGPLWRTNMALALCSFLNPCWLLGLRRLTQWDQTGALAVVRALRLSWLALAAIHFVFWVRYLVPDQATFILPTLGLLAVGLGWQLRDMRQWSRRRCGAWLVVSWGASVVMPLMVCYASERLLPPRKRVPPYRNEFAYWAYPWKHHERSAEEFVEALAAGGYPAGMVVWVDTTGVAPVLAAQAQGRLPASWQWLSYWQNQAPAVIEKRLRESPGGGYVLSPVAGYTPTNILMKADFEVHGVLHRIVWRKEEIE